MYHSVYFAKQPPHKVYPHLFLCFFVDLSNKVAEKIASLFYLFSSKHMHPPGPYISERATRPRMVVDLGHWELSLIQRWRAEGMVGFSLITVSSILQG